MSPRDITGQAAEQQRAYVPGDRLQALAEGAELPGRTEGSALFADISGFTTLTGRLARELGLRRGAEELARHLDSVWHELIGPVLGLAGSVISFSGDAITCWFDLDDGRRALTCAFALQEAMQQFQSGELALSLKVAVARGPVRRLVVGDPKVQLLDVIAGATLDRLALAENVARAGEIVVDMAAAESLGERLDISGWRTSAGQRFAVAGRLHLQEPRQSPADLPGVPDLRSWLLPSVYERLQAGHGELLTELRPAAAVFIGFSGVDYDADEQAGQRLDSFIRHVQARAATLGGALLQLTIGDKGSYLYVTFGAPVSNEDDSRRAVSLALQLNADQAAFSFLEPLRIGISRGLMRTGAYGSSGRRTYGVLGDETNMAARLMSHAAPGQVLVTAAVQLETRGQFRWSEPASLQVKGRSEPVTVFEPLSAMDHEAQLTRRSAGTVLGRSAELEQLLRQAQSARQGRGRTVLVSGEAGIGKTSLLTALLALPELADSHVLVGEADSSFSDTPYLPFRHVLRSLLGLGTGAVTAAALEAALTAHAADLAQRLPLLGPVFGVQVPDTPLTASLDGELRKSAREGLLLELLRRAARQAAARDTSLVLLIENLQWCDSLSREVIAAVERMSAGLPLLLLLSTRPEAAAAVGAGALHLPLAPLSGEAAGQLLAARLGQARVAPALRERILRQGQGNPLYLTELADYVRSTPAGLEADELPASLQSLVLSRLDRLGALQQTVVKSASIIGREFRLDWLDGYYPLAGGLAELSGHAGDLDRLELLQLSRPVPLTYVFRQVLTRDISYSSIPFSLRSDLHTRLARFLEGQATPAEPLLEQLAVHYGLGNDVDSKHVYLKRAGIAAQESYANDTALRWFGELLPELTGADRLEVLQRRGQVLMHMGRYAEAEAGFRESLGLAVSLADRHGEAVSMRLLGELSEKQGDYEGSVSWLRQALDVFDETGEEPELIQVLLALGGNVLWQQGEYAEAGRHLDRALELAREHGAVRSEARALHGLGNIELHQGRLPAARQLFEESLDRRRAVGDSLGIANALNNLGIIAAMLDDAGTARRHFEESLQLRRQIGDLAGTAVALNNVGFMAAEQGDLHTAFEMNFESLGLRREIGDRLGIAVTLNSLGYLQYRLENSSEAAAHLTESLQLLADMGNVRETAAALIGAAALLVSVDRVLGTWVALAAEAQLNVIEAAMDKEVQDAFDRVVAGSLRDLGEVQLSRLRNEAAAADPARVVSTALEGLHGLLGQPAD